jgi:broad specificity phosphatase PhoE
MTARIGLIRHFPVKLDFPSGWRTSAELMAWLEEYDRADVNIIKPDLGGIAWQKCISSDLPRAYTTATTIFSGPVERTPLLREIRFARFQTGQLRLPVWLWKRILEIAWLTGHRTQRPNRDELLERVRKVADRLEEADTDTLVASHAGIMAYLSAELRRRGLKGPRLKIARHATVHVYSR